MISAKESLDNLINLEIQVPLLKNDVLKFLLNKGYEVKHLIVHVAASEEFLVSEPAFNYLSYTAVKNNEKPTMDDLYLDVFKREIQEILKNEIGYGKP